MTKNEYNGYYNYETWVVSLWMDNDQGSQSYWQERAQECWDNTPEDDDRKHTATCDLADEIKQYHEDYEQMGINIPNSVYADLMNAALSEVNWYEIASHLIEEVDKE